MFEENDHRAQLANSKFKRVENNNFFEVVCRKPPFVTVYSFQDVAKDRIIFDNKCNEELCNSFDIFQQMLIILYRSEFV